MNYGAKKKRNTIICLINSAAYCRTFFEALEAHLNDEGVDVYYVVDSHLTDVVFANGSPLPNARYFTDYCSVVLRSGKSVPFENSVTWAGLFSDFDRYLTMDIPIPLRKGCGLSFSAVPGLLRLFFQEIFDEIAPVGVLYEQASNSFALAACDEARRRSIPFLSLAPARVSGRMEISTTGALRDWETVGKIYIRIQQDGASAESRRIANDYIENIETRVPDYMRAGGDGEILARTGLMGKYLRVEKLRHFWRIVRYTFQHREDVALAYMHGNATALSQAYFKRSLQRRLRVPRIQRFFQKKVEAESYFLYPLHFHPEASTSVLAPDFVDELSVIKSIAFRLPSHVSLVVKEHPSAVGLQPINFYRQLNALPNVILVGPDANSKKLARASLGVICITSTLGFEAAVMNKPVICFGDVLFGYFPNVKMINSYLEFENALEWALKYSPLSRDIILDALTAYVEYTEPGTFSFKESSDDCVGLRRIAKYIVDRIK